MSSQYIGIASAVLNLISAVPYVYAIFKGNPDQIELPGLSGHS